MTGDRFLTLSVGPDVMSLSMTKKRPTLRSKLSLQIEFLHGAIVHKYVYRVKRSLGLQSACTLCCPLKTSSIPSPEKSLSERPEPEDGGDGCRQNYQCQRKAGLPVIPELVAARTHHQRVGLVPHGGHECRRGAYRHSHEERVG